LPRTNGSRKKKEIAKKIKKWLAEEGFQASKVQDTNTDFHFQIQNPNMSNNHRQTKDRLCYFSNRAQIGLYNRLKI